MRLIFLITFYTLYHHYIFENFEMYNAQIIQAYERKTNKKVNPIKITDEQIDAKFDIEDLRGCYGIAGVDLSSTTDLTAAIILVVKDNKKYELDKGDVQTLIKQFLHGL